MMAHLWLYRGSLDASGNVLTLDTEGPASSGPGNLARYRNVIEFLADASPADGKKRKEREP